MTDNDFRTELTELMSAVQKCIRRGMIYEACHFAVRLEELNPSYLWNRLEVIASEDIGVADNSLVLVVAQLRKTYTEKEAKRKGDGALFLTHAVHALAKSPKSRDNDDLCIVVGNRRKLDGEKLPIPDFALDKHTLRGKKMGRGFEHFFREGAILTPDVGTHEWEADSIQICLAEEKRKRSRPKIIHEEDPAHDKTDEEGNGTLDDFEVA